jgi:hypothetical protein
LTFRQAALTVGTPTFDDPHGVTTDDKGNVYIVGQTEGSLAGPYRGIFDAWIVEFFLHP